MDQVNDSETRTAIFFDGSCPLCPAEIEFYRRRDRAETLHFVDVSMPDAKIPNRLDREEALAPFHVMASNGQLVSGAAAFAEVWNQLPGWGYAGKIANLPAFNTALEICYRFFLVLRPAFVRAFKLASRVKEALRNSFSKSVDSECTPYALRGVPVAAQWLGFLGLLPFGAAVVIGLVPESPLHDIALPALLAYGSVILSFLGGIRWGLAVVKTDAADLLGPLLISVLPSVLGWIALLMPASVGLLLLVLGFLALLLADVRLRMAPPWYGALRLPLSIGAIGALLLGLLI